MKKIASLILVICMLVASTVSAYAAVPKVIVGGESLKSDVAPINVDGRILLPLRAVFESIGAEVNYIAAEQRVVATKKGTTVEFVIGSNIMKINGQQKTIDVPAMIKDNRTLVPLRACAEAFNLPIEWNQKTNTAKVRIPVSLISSEYHYATRSNTTYKYDDRGNQIERNQNGYITKWFYDENDNIIRIESTYSTSDRIYTYNENGDVATCESFTTMDSGSTHASKTTYKYDGRRNLIYGESTENSRNYYEYDERGNRIKTKAQDGINALTGEPTYSTTTYEYDDRNNMTLSYSGENAWFRYLYDDYNNMIFGEFNEWNHNYPTRKVTYDKENSVLYVADGENGEYKNQWKLTYDQNNKLIYRSDNYGNYVKYEYDKDGNLIYYEDNKGYGGSRSWEKYEIILK